MRFRVFTLANVAAMILFIAGTFTIPTVLYMGEKTVSENKLLEEVAHKQQEDRRKIQNLEKASWRIADDFTRISYGEHSRNKDRNEAISRMKKEIWWQTGVSDLDYINSTSLVDLSKADASIIKIALHHIEDSRFHYFQSHPYNLTVELMKESRLIQARCLNPPFIQIPEKQIFVDDVEIYTINLLRRDDRRREFLAHWCTSRFGEMFRWRFYFFRGTTKEELSVEETNQFSKDYQRHWAEHKSKAAAYKSHWDALEHFRAKKSKHHLLMLQDDAECRDAIVEKFIPFMESVPENWDLIYWGGKPVDRLPLAPDGTHNLSLNDPWWKVVFNYDAQAVMYNNKNLDMMSLHMKKGFKLGEFFDIQLSLLTGTHKFVAGYMPTEIFCGQRNGYSDITGKKRSHKVVEKYRYWCSSLNVYDNEIIRIWGKSNLMVGLPLGVYNIEPGCHHNMRGVKANTTHSMRFIMRALRVDPRTIRQTPQLISFQRLDSNRSYYWEPHIWDVPL